MSSKVLVLVTDGDDNGSHMDLQDAIEAAQKSNVIVYVLVVGGRGDAASSAGAPDMARLAEETGGRAIAVSVPGQLGVPVSSRQMENVFAEIEDELRTQYLISYEPLNTTMDGKYRNVAIHCERDGEDLTVQARTGYYALKAGEVKNQDERSEIRLRDEEK